MWYTFTIVFLPLSSWASQFTPFVSKSVQQLQHHHRKKTVSQGNPAHPKTDKTTPISTPAFPVPLPPCQLRLPPWPLRGGKPSPGFEDFQAKFKGEPHNSLLSAECFFAAFFSASDSAARPGQSLAGPGRKQLWWWEILWFYHNLRLVLDDFFCHGRFEKEVPTRFPILGEIYRQYSGKSSVTHTRNGSFWRLQDMGWIFVIPNNEQKV